ncbi:hypothetical protein ACPCTN_32040 [Streptomyces cinereoruber]|uniref:hypothetical protein n=1 Tax=Streptomyces cinereoruber TaxID=67260 RepID=UPI003C2B9D5C
MEVQQHMTQKPQRKSKAVLAREAAREKAARFREQEDERLRIAEAAILIQEEIDDFDAETERRVAKLREERNSQLVEKRQKLDALVVEMLDTEIPAQQASERLGMSVGQVRAAKRSFEQMVAALAEGPANDATVSTSSPATATAEDAEASTASSADDETALPPSTDETEVAPPATQTTPATESYEFPPPGGSPVVPAQEGSPENLQDSTLPPGSAG